jgi:hypothetical protein
MNRIRYYGFVLCAIGSASLAGCERKEMAAGSPVIVVEGNSNAVKQVQTDVSRILSAVYSNDLETVLAYTNPKIIEMMGGKTKATSTLQDALQGIQPAEMSLESLSFPTAPTFLKGDHHEFVIVPTKSIIIARGQRLESLNYQFGVKDSGRTNWTYIEGSRINSTNVIQLFPDFPSNFVFPSFHRKKL